MANNGYLRRLIRPKIRIDTNPCPSTNQSFSLCSEIADDFCPNLIRLCGDSVWPRYAVTGAVENSWALEQACSLVRLNWLETIWSVIVDCYEGSKKNVTPSLSIGMKVSGKMRVYVHF